MFRTLFFVLLVCLALTACGGIATLDPQGSPEGVARAWMQARYAGDCAKVASYMSPDVRSEIDTYCGPAAYYCLRYNLIDDAVARPMGGIWGDMQMVTLVGAFEELVGRYSYGSLIVCGESDHDPRSVQDTYTIGVEPLKGKWYVNRAF